MNNNEIKSISFSGGGYNCVYHLGVVKYIFEHIELFQDYHYLGASGGAGIGAIILCYKDNPDKFNILDKIIKEIMEIKEIGIKQENQVTQYINIMLKYITNDLFNLHIINNNKCHISITKFRFGFVPVNHIINDFISYDDYIDHITASASIPLILDNKLRKVRDDFTVDGGITNNNPVLNSSTIIISCLNINPFTNPFISKYHIYPKEISEIRYSITPPNKIYLQNLFILGYNDIQEFMDNLNNKNDLETKISQKNIINNLFDITTNIPNKIISKINNLLNNEENK